MRCAVVDDCDILNGGSGAMANSEHRMSDNDDEGLDNGSPGASQVCDDSFDRSFRVESNEVVNMRREQAMSAVLQQLREAELKRNWIPDQVSQSPDEVGSEAKKTREEDAQRQQQEGKEYLTADQPEAIVPQRLEYTLTTGDDTLVKRLQRIETDAWCTEPITITTIGRPAAVIRNNYCRDVKFSPSGSHLAVSTQDHTTRIFPFQSDTAQLATAPSGLVHEGGLIYDMAWMPTTSSAEPRLATSAQGHPVHLYDQRGIRSASYTPINHLDELDSALCIGFSADGSRLLTGFRKRIRIFDVNRPGRQIEDVVTWTKQCGGQRSQITSLAWRHSDGVFAAGCRSSLVVLYCSLSGQPVCALDHLLLSPAVHASVSQLAFSSDGRRLFVAGRRGEPLTVWDLRSPQQPLALFDRPLATQQAIRFQLDQHDELLFSGSSTGHVMAFSLAAIGMTTEPIDPTWKMAIAKCAVSSVSLHPSLPVLACSSGERVFPIPYANEPECGEDGTEIKADEQATHYRNVSCQTGLDNSVQLWQVGSLGGNRK